jgi:hypothetical protein
MVRRQIAMPHRLGSARLSSALPGSARSVPLKSYFLSFYSVLDGSRIPLRSVKEEWKKEDDLVTNANTKHHVVTRVIRKVSCYYIA